MVWPVRVQEDEYCSGEGDEDWIEKIDFEEFALSSFSFSSSIDWKLLRSNVKIHEPEYSCRSQQPFVVILRSLHRHNAHIQCAQLI